MENSTPALRALSLLAVLAALGACDSSTPPPMEQASKQRHEVAESREVAKGEAAAEPTANRPPLIRGIEFEPESPVPGDTLRVVVRASDDDKDRVFFDYEWWIDGEPLDNPSAKLVLEHATRGQVVEVSVVANDGKDESAPYRAEVELENSPPRIKQVTLNPGQQVFAGTPIVVKPEARDGDGDGVTFSYEWEVNGRGVREDGPSLDTHQLKRGNHVTVRIVASDGEDESEPYEAPMITIVNAPPKIVSRPPDALANGEFVYRVVAEDPDGDSGIQFELENQPEGMSVEPLTGVIRWTPTLEQAGRYSVSVFADDLQGGRSRQVFEVAVSAPEEDAAAAPAP